MKPAPRARGHLVVLFIGLLPLGCFHRLTGGDVKRSLRELEPLETERQIVQPPRRLEDTPMVPGDEIFRAARDLFVPVPVEGGVKRVDLDLDDVRSSALANNLALRVDRLGAASADQLAIAEAWKFEPFIDFALTAQEERDPADDRAATLSVQPSLTIPNHLGGRVELSYPHTSFQSRQIVGFDPITMAPVREGNTITTGPSVSLRQPLLRLGGIAVTYASVNVAGLQARQAEARAKLAALRVLATSEQSYWRYYSSYEELRIQLSKYEFAKDQLRFARRLVEEGVRTRVEVTRAEAGVAREFANVIAAELRRRQSERGLKRILNMSTMPVESAVAIEPRTAPAPVNLVFDRAAVVSLAVKKRMDVFDAELQIAIDETRQDQAVNLALPAVDVEFRYQFQGSERSFDDALRQIFRRDSDQLAFGVFVNLPIFLDRGGWARHRSAELNTLQSRAFREALELVVREEVLNAVDAVELAWQRVLATRQSVELARETYEAERTQFGLGAITTTELLIQLDAYATAQLSYVFSRSDFQNALVDLAFSTGTMLGDAGVTWRSDGEE